ncbi:MAG TPA: hypothetical protein VG268_17250 [Streptosporangiaceae bacterium]|nr:hypothetical protein [Streptosporangiaceae bacterium]
MMAIAGSLTAVVLLLSVQGCGTTADATTDAVGPTPAAALKVFNSYVTANKVAVANRDQLLAESLTSSAQFSILSSQYDIAASTGVPVTSPSYGKPTLYVPKLTTYPQWFMAAVPEYPAHGGQPRTVVMVFDRTEASTGWTLDGTAQMASGTPALNVAVNQEGYATALPTTDPSLEFPPDAVGATHASVVDEGPSSPAAKVVAAGPQTTGIYQTNAAYAAKIRPGHWIYTWQMEGTSFPFFALRMTDGGAVVFYTMSLNQQTVPAIKPPSHPKVQPPSIPVPDVYKPLLSPDQAPFIDEFDTGSTLQFLAVDPPGAKNGSTATGKLRIIGNGGGLTFAGGK